MSRQWSIDLEAAVKSLLRNVESNVITTDPNSCEDRLRRLLCVAAYPQCGKDNDRLMVCKERCLAVKELFCKQTWLELPSLILTPTSGGSGAVNGLMREVGKMVDQNCQLLPSLRGSQQSEQAVKMEKDEAPRCAEVDLEPELKDRGNNVTVNCYWGRGQFYVGNVTMSSGQTACLSWSDAIKLDPTFYVSPLVFPSLGSAGKSCRNPGGVREVPFCIPENPTQRAMSPYTDCGLVQSCLHLAAVHTTAGPIDTEKIIIASVAGSVLFVLLFSIPAGIAICISRRRKKWLHASGNKPSVFYPNKDYYQANMMKPPGPSAPTPACPLLLACGGIVDKCGPNLGMGGSNCAGGNGQAGFAGVGSDAAPDLNIEMTRNHLYNQPSMTAYLHPKLKQLEYPRDLLIELHPLGRGAFGEVFLAKAPYFRRFGVSGSTLPLQSSPTVVPGEYNATQQTRFGGTGGDNSASVPSTPLLGEKGGDAVRENGVSTSEQSGTLRVAVKVLKMDATQASEVNFLREAETMVELDHPNIIKLIGICAASKPLCLLLEYMPNRDLNTFLDKHNPSHLAAGHLPSTACFNGDVKLQGEKGSTGMLVTSGKGREGAVDSPVKLDKVVLIKMAVNICSGMVCVSNNSYVHRDLATRSCLVDTNLTVKIADFSLCRPAKCGADYIGEESECIPVRWLPLESIEENRFHLDTDVWSFGVVLWELFSYAQQPYAGMDHHQVLEFLRTGNCLERPERCPQLVYELMQRCWNRDRRQRPSFVKLLGQLNELIRRWTEEEGRVRS